MKRLISLVLALLMVLSTFSLFACGNTSVTSNSGNTESPVTTTEAPIENETPIGETIKLMTFNLRYDTTSHECMSTDIRGGHLMEIIKKYLPDSVGFNEATNDWMNYLRVAMKEYNYECVGVGRDSGATGTHLSGTGNEHTPVFYRADKYELLDSGTFWLSDTPAMRGTVSWNSACKRVCTYAVLKNKETGETYAHFSTHLDHKSVEAQYNGVMVIESYVRQIVETYGDIGIVLSGDFNATRFDNTQPSYVPTTYNTVTSFMDDSRDLATQKLVDGSSWSGYQNPAEWEKGHVSNNDKPAVDTSTSPIDYIFLKKNCYSVSLYTIVDDVFTFNYKGATFTNHPVSDHYGVYCEAQLIKKSNDIETDDKKLINTPATITTVDSVPEALLQKLVNTDFFTVSSSLTIKPTAPLANLVTDDTSLTAVTVVGKNHGFWEIILTFNKPVLISGISLRTGNNTDLVPQTLRVYTMRNGSTWNRLGSTVYDINANATYLITPQNNLPASAIKIQFADTINNGQLENIAVYGSVQG